MLNEMISMLGYKNTLGPLVSANLVLALLPVAENPIMQAKMRSWHVVPLVNRMLDLYEKNFFVAEFLDLLQAIAIDRDDAIDRTVIKENQLTIVTHLMKGDGTLSSDLLGKPERISSWGGFDEVDSSRLHDDARQGTSVIILKTSSILSPMTESGVGIVVGDKVEEYDEVTKTAKTVTKQELHMIRGTSQYTDQDGVELTKITLKKDLKYAHESGTVVVKPSLSQVTSPVQTRSELEKGMVTLKCEDDTAIVAGVDIILGTGKTKELNTVKSTEKIIDEKWDKDPLVAVTLARFFKQTIKRAV